MCQEERLANARFAAFGDHSRLAIRRSAEQRAQLGDYALALQKRHSGGSTESTISPTCEVSEATAVVITEPDHNTSTPA
jgi:hypothetical protein